MVFSRHRIIAQVLRVYATSSQLRYVCQRVDGKHRSTNGDEFVIGITLEGIGNHTTTDTEKK
ncbi:MAG: hypothetical protein RBJ76_13290 [Stenomitos frigidus ULC029]